SDREAILAVDSTFPAGDQGSHTFGAVLRTAGTRSLTATDTVTAITGSQQGIVVNPGAVYALRIIGLPSVVNAKEVVSFTIQAVDAYGNVVPDYNGTVHFSSSDPKATLPADYAFTSGDRGSHTFGATFRKRGRQ